MGLFKDQGTKTGRNSVTRHKLTGEDGYIKVLDSSDFVQFCKQRGFDLHHKIDGKKISQLAWGVPGTHGGGDARALFDRHI